MAMQLLKVRITGTRPMLMHSDVLSDPLNKLTREHKALTSKRKKTEEDHLEIAKSEFRASLYYRDDIGVFIPSVNIEASIREGAKLSKLGKHVQRAVEVAELEIPLEYEGARDPDGLWNEGAYDARSVKVSTARLTRYRPFFKQWAAEFTISFNDSMLNRVEVLKALTDAGEFCGIGDFRPKYGRFKVEVIG